MQQMFRVAIIIFLKFRSNLFEYYNLSHRFVIDVYNFNNLIYPSHFEFEIELEDFTERIQ